VTGRCHICVIRVAVITVPMAADVTHPGEQVFPDTERNTNAAIQSVPTNTLRTHNSRLTNPDPGRSTRDKDVSLMADSPGTVMMGCQPRVTRADGLS
jgi:hypothetical protein